MSGLTLGLMSLDKVDLEILRRSGTAKQQKCADKILPVISNPHRLLVTLLVCNAVATEALPLVLDRLTDPITAVIISVTVVLFFGEIIPQAACASYGLEIGAASAGFVRLLLVLVAPLNIPIGWILDKVLSHRTTALFRRAQLKALVDIHGKNQEFGGHLSADEVRIIKSALDLTNKRAKAAMTPIDMVFMLPMDAVLNEATLTAVLASGHSRIPVHQRGNRCEILGILLVKELILVDVNAGVRVSSMKIRSLPCLLGETPMYDLLKLFEMGRTHMVVLAQPTREALMRMRAEAHEAAIDIYSISDGDFGSDDDEILRRTSSSPLSSDGESDDGDGINVFSINFQPNELQLIGIITIEDVLEELIGSEIIDETDIYMDNVSHVRVNAVSMASSLPPHLRKALTTWTLTPRVGPALQVYRMSSFNREPSWSSTPNPEGPLLATAAAAATTMSTESPTRLPTLADAEAGMAGSAHVTSTFTSGLDMFAPHAARTLRPSSPALTRSLSVEDVFSAAAAGARTTRQQRGRRSINMSQGVQDQLDLLQPLIDVREERRNSAPSGSLDGLLLSAVQEAVQEQEEELGASPFLQDV